MSTIKTIAQLRQVVGEAPPGLADKNIDHIDDFAQAFIARAPFVVLTTADQQGHMDASPKGDAPGFVMVADPKTIIIPDRPGNKLAYGHENILKNPHVGLLFVVPGTSETLRVNGTSELSVEPELLESLAARGKPAQLAIVVSVQECFFHCAKAFLRSGLWKPDTWGEPHRVSFGEMFAARRGLSDSQAKGIDEMIEHDYQTNL